jgi:hypothetical protein
MERPIRTGLAALVVLACTACNPVVMGNGVFATRTFEVDAFDRLEVEYGFTVNVVAGRSPRALEISGDENIVFQYLDVRVVDSTLHIGRTQAFDRIHAISVHLDAPELVALTAREESRVAVTGASSATFDVQASEGSVVVLSGDPPDGAALAATLDTGAALDARAYPVASAAVSLASHSEARLTCGGPVTGSASGRSTVSVQGGGTCQVALSGSPSDSICTAAP